MLELSQKLLNDVLQIAHQAGRHLREFYQQSVDIQIKSDNTPVTNADLFISRFLTEKLTALTPNIPVLSEECCDISLAQRQQWQSYWIIDPLDGTQQFINRTDQFAVLIALVQHNRSVLGVIHAPILERTFYAMKGFGAFKCVAHQTSRLNARELDFSRPIKIALGSKSAQKRLQPMLKPEYQYEFVIFGSSGLKSTLVADGEADCYVRQGKTGEWDTAASEILLEEIGGIICNTAFRPLVYNQRDSLENPDFLMLCSKQAQWRELFDFN
ncbi:3'(2'),5'-bisphosphate nucleotidase [Cricetibacter osteomyelitidis]|uniref:3'(2'),5'-bisphosphate nucleotidase CysQ n=1 Tax=Cricetibacter osteomyelitidis TaxID=1521931 RepID=A0A4R2T4Z2_9PAST|nr:3'(2'),5'-bisphosphate nucleotidase CysQ [Cricetibacter osteomyelitidis]TCP96591.1 3'(2'),5'-bisphosphate nucleotidase [Cricetibacter osteomyelitidis]